jgi:hypothetical protein
MKTTTRTNSALDEFVAAKTEIDAMLARLQALSDDHFNYAPDEIHWGHVGSLATTRNQLKDICDRMFGEGEYAPDAR